MIDLDAIRASRAACADIPWSCPCVSGEQLDALLEEVEHMREQRRIDNEEAARLYDFSRDKGQALERAAVVAWLLAGTADCRDCMDAAVVRLAREIERGEHRREESKP